MMELRKLREPVSAVSAAHLAIADRRGETLVAETLVAGWGAAPLSS
jgi:hypothetical protein